MSCFRLLVPLVDRQASHAAPTPDAPNLLTPCPLSLFPYPERSTKLYFTQRVYLTVQLFDFPRHCAGCGGQKAGAVVRGDIARAVVECRPRIGRVVVKGLPPSHGEGGGPRVAALVFARVVVGSRSPTSRREGG